MNTLLRSAAGMLNGPSVCRSLSGCVTERTTPSGPARPLYFPERIDAETTAAASSAMPAEMPTAAPMAAPMPGTPK